MKFQKGKSGNPAGRPKGTKDFRNVLTTALIRENQGKIKQVIDRLFEFALEEKDGFFGGDKLLQYPWLGKLLLEYFLVKPNSNSTSTDIDESYTITAEVEPDNTSERQPIRIMGK
jgi:hypothetical protein